MFFLAFENSTRVVAIIENKDKKMHVLQLCYLFGRSCFYFKDGAWKERV
jgi:hypothetical protein